ncbi:hypothetical protein [Marinomonas colpomeniae]|uniref:hypothetical protein n=1 Tax=Marinomonas colpomeniae TaxID=2774408 RepID=UPI0019D5AD5A|nr:hypothetical protein [Marinomonas colpomeniae]
MSGQPKLSPIQTISDKIIHNNFAQDPAEGVSYGLLWCKAEYHRGDFSKVTKEKYKDYVELASALDWIDGDASSDDA